MLTLTQAYEYYKQKGGELSYRDWRDICESFNEKAVDSMLEGKRIELFGNMGYLQVIRIPRNFNKPRVNWKASYELRDKLLEEGKKLYDDETGEGEKWIVYYTDDWYLRYYWSKKYCRVKGRSVYRFVPTRGKVGAKNKLADLMKDDELAYLKFAKSSDV